MAILIAAQEEDAGVQAGKKKKKKISALSSTVPKAFQQKLD